jgi:hypothetical protein
MSPVVFDNKNIIVIRNKRMQNSATIVVSLYEGQEELNIVRRAGGLGNQKGLTK